MGYWVKDPAPVLLNGYGFVFPECHRGRVFPCFDCYRDGFTGEGCGRMRVAIPAASPGMICGLSGPKSATHPGIHARGSRAGVSGRFVPFVAGNPEGSGPR